MRRLVLAVGGDLRILVLAVGGDLRILVLAVGGDLGVAGLDVVRVSRRSSKLEYEGRNR